MPAKKIPRERLDYVRTLYLKGRAPRVIQERTSKKFGVKPRQVRHYMHLVAKALAALPKPDPDAVRARAEDMLLEAYRFAKIGGKFGPDAKGMVAAAARLAELDGLLTKKVEHGGSLTIDPNAVLADIRTATGRSVQADPGAVSETAAGDTASAVEPGEGAPKAE